MRKPAGYGQWTCISFAYISTGKTYVIKVAAAPFGAVMEGPDSNRTGLFSPLITNDLPFPTWSPF